MKTLVVLSLLCMVAWTASAQEGHTSHSQKIEDEMTFEKFTALLSSHNVTTIEDAIRLLPFEMINDNYVLMYRSRSLQHGSPDSPRAIVYTPSARFIVTFNGGEASAAGNNTLEIVQFRDQDARFEFREIEFSVNGSAPNISAANPAKCLECHQSSSRTEVDLRPNWEPYSIWPGAFGSHRGLENAGPLSKSISFMRDRYQPQDAEFVAEQATELDLLKTYKEQIAPRHPRFSKLGTFNFHSPTELTEHLGYLNFQRVSRLILANGEVFATYEPIIEYMIRCNPRKVWEKNELYKWHRAQSLTPYYDYSGDDPAVSNYLTPLFEPFGVDTSDWSMDFKTRGRYSFRERFGLPSSGVKAFTKVWSRLRPADSTFAKMSCADLEKSSQTGAQEIYKTGKYLEFAKPLMREPRTAEQTLERCNVCHSGHTGYPPFIPFGDRAALSIALKQRGHKRGTLLEEIAYRTSETARAEEQMPKAGVLTIDDRATLMDYLSKLEIGN